MLEGGGAPKCPCKNVNMPEYWLLVLVGTHSSRFKCKMVSTPECSDKNIFRGGKKKEGSNIFWENLGGKKHGKNFLEGGKKIWMWQKMFAGGKNILGRGVSLFF